MVKNTFLAIIIVLLGFSDAQSQFGSKSTYRFLNIPVSPQATSLGGIPVSLMDADPAQMHLNPAFLDSTANGRLSVSYARFLSDANIGFVSGAYDLPGLGTLGAGLRFVNYGTLDRIDEYGIDRGTFSVSDVAFKVALSRRFDELFQYGIAVDFILSSYDSYSSTGVAFSGGILYKTPDDIIVGLSFVNLGYQISTYNGFRENLPFDLRLGVTRKLLYLPLRLTFTAHNLHNWDMKTSNDAVKPTFFSNLVRHLALGGEFLFSESFKLRLGYNHFQREELKTGQRLDLVGFGIGVAIKYKGIGIEFGRNSYSDMGGLLQLGINTRI